MPPIFAERERREERVRRSPGTPNAPSITKLGAVEWPVIQPTAGSGFNAMDPCAKPSCNFGAGGWRRRRLVHDKTHLLKLGPDRFLVQQVSERSHRGPIPAALRDCKVELFLLDRN